MSNQNVEDFVRQAEEFYADRLRDDLEREHMDEFVAIEPISGSYFLAATLSEATQAARRTFPDRPTHVMRIGHRAAIHFGHHFQ